MIEFQIGSIHSNDTILQASQFIQGGNEHWTVNYTSTQSVIPIGNFFVGYKTLSTFIELGLFGSKLYSSV